MNWSLTEGSTHVVLEAGSRKSEDGTGGKWKSGTVTEYKSKKIARMQNKVATSWSFIPKFAAVAIWKNPSQNFMIAHEVRSSTHTFPCYNVDKLLEKRKKLRKNTKKRHEIEFKLVESERDSTTHIKASSRQAGKVIVTRKRARSRN